MNPGPTASPSIEFASSSGPRLRLVRGEGARLWDTNGRVYIDLGATHGVGNLGAVEAKDSPSHGRPRSVTLSLPPLGCLFLRPAYDSD